MEQCKEKYTQIQQFKKVQGLRVELVLCSNPTSVASSPSSPTLAPSRSLHTPLIIWCGLTSVSLVPNLASWTGSYRELVARSATILQPLLQTSSRLQLLSLYSMQESRSSCLLHWFMALYQEDSVQEEVFLTWRDDLNPSYMGKGEALVQVNRWLTWLEEEETEDEVEDEWE